MAFLYNAGIKAILDKAMAASALDLRAELVMTNTTVDTQNDGIATLSDFTTLDRHDGSGYAAVALTGEATAKDDANNRATLDANNVVFTALGAGTRSIDGVLIKHHVDGTDANDIPVFYDDVTNVASNGGDITYNVNATALFAIAGVSSP